MGALPPDECAALARRAAVLVDAAALPQAGASESVVLWQDADSVAWLNVVLEPRDTGFHDHDGSAVGVHVIAGSVTNEGLPVGGTRRVRRYRAGDSYSVPAAGIHRMNHEVGAITVHVYSPPLRAIGYYEVVHGLLQRTPGPPDEASPESPRLLAALKGEALTSRAP
jgi:quercetin dioxygenase-like cupin family protein